MLERLKHPLGGWLVAKPCGLFGLALEGPGGGQLKFRFVGPPPKADLD